MVDKQQDINVPKLRFPAFDKELVSTYLSKLAEVNPKSKSLPGKFIYIDLESVKDGFLLKEKWFVSDNAPSRAQRVLSKKDVLFQTVRPYQKNNLFFNKNGHYVASTGYAQIRVKNNVPEYIYQFLYISKFVKKVLARCSGTSYPAISGNDLAKIIITIPQIKEQQKIADFLSAVDKKIEMISRKKGLFEQYKKGLMQQIFSQELRFKNDDGSDFPDWEEKKLGDIGKTYSGLTGRTKKDFGSGKPYVQYKQVFDNNYINIDQFGYVFVENGTTQNKTKIGDVFFTASSETPKEIATSSVLLESVEELYLNSFCFGYRINDFNTLAPGFAQFYFRCSVFRKMVSRLAQGSTRYNISKIGMMKLLILLPRSHREQQKISDFLSIVDKKIMAIEEQLKRAKQFKKALLQQMFV